MCWGDDQLPQTLHGLERARKRLLEPAQLDRDLGPPPVTVGDAVGGPVRPTIAKPHPAAAPSPPPAHLGEPAPPLGSGRDEERASIEAAAAREGKHITRWARDALLAAATSSAV